MRNKIKQIISNSNKDFFIKIVLDNKLIVLIKRSFQLLIANNCRLSLKLQILNYYI